MVVKVAWAEEAGQGHTCNWRMRSFVWSTYLGYVRGWRASGPACVHTHTHAHAPRVKIEREGGTGICLSAAWRDMRVEGSG